MAFTVIYDANVLFTVPLRDLLIRVSLTGIVRARWTNEILDECFRNVLALRPDLSEESLRRTRELMNLAIREPPRSPGSPISETQRRNVGVRAPVKTGEVLRMEESYGEGVATHTGPESCAGGGNFVGEALTGVRAGRVLSRENTTPGCRRRGHGRKATPSAPTSRGAQGPCAVGDPEHARKHLAREPGGPAPVCGKGAADRIGEPKGVSRW